LVYKKKHLLIVLIILYTNDLRPYCRHLSLTSLAGLIKQFIKQNTVGSKAMPSMEH